VPIGTVITWPLNTIPKNYLECNGQYVAPSLYPKLAKLMNYTPDYRGIFLRGYGTTTSTHFGIVTHQSGSLGEIQGDAIRNITGGWNAGDNEMAESMWGAFYHGVYIEGANLGARNDYAYESVTFDSSRMVPVANEDRPINKAVIYLIKAK